MWQRWNSTTKIFEKSGDNGASWTPLGLDASIITQGVMDPARLPPYPPVVTIPPNIAFTNVENEFLGPEQTLKTLAFNYAQWLSRDMTGPNEWGAGSIGGNYSINEYGVAAALTLAKATGNANFRGRVVTGVGFASIEGSALVASGTAEGVFAFPNGLGAYLVYYFIDANDPVNYAGLCVVFTDGPAARLAILSAGNLIAPALVGLTLRIQQTSGVTLTVNARGIRIL
jgi:hypothetical protein